MKTSLFEDFTTWDQVLVYCSRAIPLSFFNQILKFIMNYCIQWKVSLKDEDITRSSA